MSATGRGAIRNASDYYPTPESAFKPLIPLLPKPAATIWEPASGDGRLIRWMREAELAVRGDDINNGYDFLKETRKHLSSCIVTNPPYSLAFEFAQKAREVATECFLLLRLNFLASKKRKAWFVANEPDALFILSERPSFTKELGIPGTDATDYAWFYWGNRHRGIYHL